MDILLNPGAVSQRFRRWENPLVMQKPVFGGTAFNASSTVAVATTCAIGNYLGVMSFRTPSVAIGTPAGFTSLDTQYSTNAAYNARLSQRFATAANEPVPIPSPNGQQLACWWSGVDPATAAIAEMAAGNSGSIEIPALVLGPGEWFIYVSFYAEITGVPAVLSGWTQRGRANHSVRQLLTWERNVLVTEFAGLTIPMGLGAGVNALWIAGVVAVKGVMQ